MNRGAVKWVAIVGGTLLLLIGIFAISYKLVKSGYSSVKVVSKVEGEKESSKISVNKVESKVFIDDDSEDDYKKTSVLFDGERMQDRQKAFLGDDYERFEEVLNDIESSYADEISKLDYTEGDEVDYKHDKSIEEVVYGKYNYLDYDAWSKFDTIYIRDTLSILGMYGTHCVVFGYAYPTNDRDELIVVDYSDVRLNPEVPELFDIGQYKDIMIRMKSTSMVELDGFNVMYAKGY